MDRVEATMEPGSSLPPILRAERESPPFGRGPWYLTIAPAYLGLFVWPRFFDSLWIEDLTRFSLTWLIGTGVFGSLLCFGLLYYIPASWGFRTGRPLGIVAASTFGTVGSEWITGVAVGLACIVWYAVGIDYAVESTLLGLQACGLIGADSAHPWDLGPIVIKSPVYLSTALFWIYITGTSGLWKMPGVVVALMRVYTPVAFLLLTAIALWQLSAVRGFRPEVAATIAVRGEFADRWRGHSSAVYLTTGFFAMAGLFSVDWGAQVRRRRDVVVGGLTGVVLAASLTAIMSAIVVAGYVSQVGEEERRVVAGEFGKVGPEGNRYYLVGDDPKSRANQGRIEALYDGMRDPLRLSFRWAVYYGIGGIPAGVILILFGLAALAPACYSASVYSQKLSTHWPRLGQPVWTWVGGAIALALGATSCASRIELISIAMGAIFAPAVGTMAGDWMRQRGDWAGVRLGINRSGIIAWGAGVGIALALEVGRMETADFGPLRVRRCPMVVFRFDLWLRRVVHLLLVAGRARARTPGRADRPGRDRPVSASAGGTSPPIAMSEGRCVG